MELEQFRGLEVLEIPPGLDGRKGFEMQVLPRPGFSFCLHYLCDIRKIGSLRDI